MKNIKVYNQILLIALSFVFFARLPMLGQGCNSIPIPTGLEWVNTESNISYNTTYILTDLDGVIVSVSNTATAFNAAPGSSFGSGTYNIIGMQYNTDDPPIPTAVIGSTLSAIGSISGCFQLSEGISYNCNNVICYNNSLLFQYSILGADLSAGRTLTLFLTDGLGNILATSGSPADFTNEIHTAYESGVSEFYIYYLNTLASEISPAAISSSTQINELFSMPAPCRNPDFEEDFIHVILSNGQSPVTSFSYESHYCNNDSNPLPITELGFNDTGVFSSSMGLMIDPQTGLIDLANSLPGTYNIVYNVEQNDCTPAAQSNFLVVIEDCCIPPVGNAGIDQMYCIGDQVQLGGAPTLVVGSEPITYHWSPAIDLTCNDCPNPITYTQISRTYTLTVTNQCGSSIDQVEVEVRSATPFELGGPIELCTSDYPYTIIGPSGYGSYIWSIGQNQLGQSKDLVVYGPANYQLVAYDNNGCEFTDYIEIMPSVNCITPYLIATKSSEIQDSNNDGLLNQGEVIHYSINLSNSVSASSTAINILLHDLLEEGLTLVQGSIVVAAGQPEEEVVTISDGNIAVSIGDLAPGEEAIVSFDVMVEYDYNGDGLILNQAVVSADNHPDVNTDYPDTDVPGDPTFDPIVNLPNLSVQKTSTVIDVNENGQLNPGEQIMYHITITNSSDALGDAQNITLIDQLADDLNYINNTLQFSSEGTGQIGGSFINNSLQASLGNLAPGQSAYISFIVIVDDPYSGDGIIENQAIVTADHNITELSDDPELIGDHDPTIDPVDLDNENCPDFIATVDFDCNESKTLYYVYITIIGEPNQQYLLTSNHLNGYNGIISNAYIDGPFSVENGYSYSVIPVDNPDPDCVKNFEVSAIECLVTPLELIDFNGVVKENHNRLSWSTSSEYNTSYFKLMRSTDGQFFESVNIQPAAGNSLQLLNYFYKDYDVKYGVYYYRLDIVDIDGKITSSPIVTLVRTDTDYTHFSVSPIPAIDVVNIAWNAIRKSSQSVTITDVLGRPVMQKSFDSAAGLKNEPISIANLPTGTYFVTLSIDEARSTLKIIKL